MPITFGVMKSPISKDLQPGDILQFRDFTVTTTTDTETRNSDGSSRTSSWESTFTRPHHTAIVSEVKGGGLIKILEQNVAPGGKKVQLHELYTKDMAPATKETQKQNAKVIVTTTISVSGTIWAYHPKK